MNKRIFLVKLIGRCGPWVNERLWPIFFIIPSWMWKSKFRCRQIPISWIFFSIIFGRKLGINITKTRPPLPLLHQNLLHGILEQMWQSIFIFWKRHLFWSGHRVAGRKFFVNNDTRWRICVHTWLVVWWWNEIITRTCTKGRYICYGNM